MTFLLIGVMTLLAFQDPGGFEATATVHPERVALGRCAVLTIDAAGAGAADCEITRFPEADGLLAERIDARVFPREGPDGERVLVARYRYRLYPLRAGPLVIPVVEVTARGNRLAYTHALLLHAEEPESEPAVDPLSIACSAGAAAYRGQCLRIDVRIPAGGPPGRLSLPFLGRKGGAADGGKWLRVDGPPLAPDAVAVGVPVMETGLKEPFLRTTDDRGKDVMIGSFRFVPVRTGSFDFEPAFLATGSGKDGDPIRYALHDLPSFDVIDLPEEGRPASFTNGVGSFDVSFDVPERTARPGDSLFLRVTIAGERGALEFLDLPRFAGLAGSFRVYGTTEGSGETGESGFSKWRVFELSPLSTAVARIPPLAFSWFDPERADYVIHRWDGIPLSVLPGEGAGAPDPGVREAERDIEPIFETISERDGRDGGFSDWHHVVLAFAGLVAAAAWVFGRTGLFRKDTATVRAGKAFSRFTRRVDPSETAGSNPDTLARAFSDYLSERFDLPGGVGLSGGAREALLSRGVAEESAADAEEMFARLDAVRFGEEGGRIDRLFEESVSLARRIDGEVDR